MTDKPGLRDAWNASPWTIKAFAALEVASLALSFAIRVIDEDEGRAIRPGGLIFSAVVTTLVIYWLLRRSRATRVVMVVWTSLTLLASIALLFKGPPFGYALAISWALISAGSLALLMHPATHLWCDRRLKLTDPDRLSRSGTTGG